MTAPKRVALQWMRGPNGGDRDLATERTVTSGLLRAHSPVDPLSALIGARASVHCPSRRFKRKRPLGRVVQRPRLALLAEVAGTCFESDVTCVSD